MVAVTLIVCISIYKNLLCGKDNSSFLTGELLEVDQASS